MLRLIPNLQAQKTPVLIDLNYSMLRLIQK